MAADKAPKKPTMAPIAAAGAALPRSRSSSGAGGLPKCNISRGPSLKDISKRLNSTKDSDKDNAAGASAPALNEITPNLPAQANATAASTVASSRLKLPQSAVTRANLSPSPSLSSVREVDHAGSESGTKDADKAKDQAMDSVDKTAKDKGSKSTPAKVLAQVTDKIASPSPADKRRIGRASLGVGFPGVAPLAPETPIRGEQAGTASKGDAVPEIVVERSTPVKDALARQPIPAGEHPLKHEWTLFYDSKTYKPEKPTNKDNVLHEWEASLLHVGTFGTVQGFARHMNNVRLPSKIVKGANYHMFKDGIRPMWEDPANKDGGKWVILIRNSPTIVDTVWANLTMALVGEVLDPDNAVCGIVVSVRPKLERVQVWTRGRDDVATLNALGQRIIDNMDLDPREMDAISLEFQANSTAVPTAGKFMRIASQRSVSSAPGVDGARARANRAPSSPIGALGLLSPPSPRGTGPQPMRRTGSASASAFAGPMGSIRHLVSTPSAFGDST